MTLARRRLLRIGAFGALALSASAAWVLYDQPERFDLDLVPTPDPDRVMRLPTLSLPGLDGRPGLALSEIAQAGTPVLLNVFASWCAPCVIEAPLLGTLRAHGVAIWGIAYRDKPEAITGFLARHGDPYARLGLDEKGDATGLLGLTGVPENILVDGTGSTRWRWASALTPDVIERALLPRWKSLV